MLSSQDVVAGSRLDDLHRQNRVPVEAEAAAGLQARGTHDLQLHAFAVAAGDPVESLGAEPLVASQLADGDVASRDDATNLSACEAPFGHVVDCDLAEGIPAIPGGAEGAPAIVLVRAFTEPLGVLMVQVPAAGLTAAALAQRILSELSEPLTRSFAGAGLTFTGTLPLTGIRAARTPDIITARRAAIETGPQVTVAVCTRDRTDDLRQLLENLRLQTYPRFSVLVVDNAPTDNRTQRLVEDFEADYRIDYIVEPRPGLSWARNRAVAAFTGEILAFADDDEVCDAWWIAEIARGFVEVPGAGAVTGIVAPAELRTETQLFFELYSGVARCRGFARAVFSPATFDQQSPLYPLPPYGAGANMAFSRQALEQIGGFDNALGSGTATLAGEDTAALSEVLLHGGTVVWQPSAVTHHRHRRDRASLEKVMLGYGRGLSAYYASIIAHHPGCVVELARLSRQALRDQLSRNGRKAQALSAMPAGLTSINRKGLLQGALLYPGARRRARRLATGTPR